MPSKLAIKIPNLVAAPKWSLEPGEEFIGRVGQRLRHGAGVRRNRTSRQAAAELLDRAGRDASRRSSRRSTEAMRGGFTVRVTMVRENRAYLHSRQVDVPWTNKKLTVKWEHFVSKLEPGQKETWTAVDHAARTPRRPWPRWWPRCTTSRWTPTCRTTGPAASACSARTTRNLYFAVREPAEEPAAHLQHAGASISKDAIDHLPLASRPRSSANLCGLRVLRQSRQSRDGRAARPRLRASWRRQAHGRWTVPMAKRPREADGRRRRSRRRSGDADGRRGRRGARRAEPDLSKVSARKNLNETAFFFPHLISDEDGEVKLEFTMPEALTEWKFLGFAHDAELRSGLLTDKVVTAKDLMVQPNPPRFLREGDVLEFTVKVSNQSPTRQTGTVRLTLADARTGEAGRRRAGQRRSTDQAFDIPPSESRTLLVAAERARRHRAF